MRNACHLCHGKFFSNPVLKLKGMPKAAQYYPEKKEFSRDNGITLTIKQCSSCGLVQHTLKPVSYFKKVITAASLSEKARQSRLGQMKNFSKRYGLNGKKILDIGSGKGMLDVLKEAGVIATGIEGGIVSKGKIKSGPFDAFISLNYLEHLPSPKNIIKNIYENTVPGAAGFITVPNFEYLLETKCFYEFVADHISYFTKKTLAYAFESNGFNVQDCQTINNDNDIAITVKKRENLELSGQYGVVNSLIKDLKNIVAEHKKVAVWGAGHRTLALLALAKLKNVEYIVDSAKFKQGKFAPIIHSNIAPPENLINKKVDLIIVMVPGIYPEEVLKKIKEMNINSKVAILKENKIKFI